MFTQVQPGATMTWSRKTPVRATTAPAPRASTQNKAVGVGEGAVWARAGPAVIRVPAAATDSAAAMRLMRFTGLLRWWPAPAGRRNAVLRESAGSQLHCVAPQQCESVCGGGIRL